MKNTEIPAKYYQHLSVKDFDKYNCVKLSLLLYLAILWLVRGYAVWIISVTNMQDRVAILQWFYPEQSGFYASLLSGVVGLFPVLLIHLRKPGAKHWVILAWRHIKAILVTLLLLDMVFNFIFYWLWQVLTAKTLYFDMVVTVVFIGLVIINQRIYINSMEFPETLEKD